MAKRWEKYCYYSGTENDLVCSWEDEMEMLLLFSLLSHVQLCDPMPGFFVLCYLLDLFKFISTESVILPNHLILCHPLLLLPSIFPSIVVFSSESALRVKWPNYWWPPMNIQDWILLGFTGLISLQSKGLSRVFFSTTAILQFKNKERLTFN